MQYGEKFKLIARTETETPHPAFSAGAELEWMAGTDCHSKRDGAASMN